MKPVLREIIPILLLAVAAVLVLHFVVQNFRIEGSSMQPNLHTGQYVLVNKTAYWFGRDPGRGDVIVFHAPDQPEMDRIKRVIALPGETIEVKRDGTVYIDGDQLDEPYLESADPGTKFGTWTVPENNYFVMGDNRLNSFDSRSVPDPVGIPRGNIVGKAWFIIWPIGNWGFAPNRSPALLEAAPG